MSDALLRCFCNINAKDKSIWSFSPNFEKLNSEIESNAIFMCKKAIYFSFYFSSQIVKHQKYQREYRKSIF